MCRHCAQQALEPVCEWAVCIVKNQTAAPPLGPPIDMHSWPGRCKNSLAGPELEMVTECECGLQLLGFWALSDTRQPADGEAWGVCEGSRAPELRCIWMSCPH